MIPTADSVFSLQTFFVQTGMLVLTHPPDHGMTLAARSPLLNNSQQMPVRYALALNVRPENTALFEQFMACCHARNYSIRTREVYWGWIKRFILFHRKRDPSVMGEWELDQFMASLDVLGRVTASTRNQALSALLLLYREVLHLDAGVFENSVRMKSLKPPCDPLSIDEVNRTLSKMQGDHWLVASLLFGTGMHVLECLRLRARDISLAKNEILVRDVRDEIVKRLGIPPQLRQAMKVQLQKVLDNHEVDMKSDWQGVYMPEPLLVEYPNVGKLLSWQYMFAAKRLPHDPCDGKVRRYHLDEREFQRALAHAVSEAGIDKSIGSHGLGTVMARHATRGQK